MAGCLPCFIIPLILFIFHRFIQPLLLRYWNPWAKKDKNEVEDKLEKMLCKDGTCFKKKRLDEGVIADDSKLKAS